VIDYSHAAAAAMYVYAIPRPTPVAQELAGVILACTQAVAHNLPHLRRRRTMRQLQPAVVELNRLENQADIVLRRGLIDLFHQPHDPQEVLAWSTIYELMEDVTDKSEDSADVLSGLLITYG
jgi:uncharacterized protein Yka (UPF0111/DUF47 family)